MAFDKPKSPPNLEKLAVISGNHVPENKSSSLVYDVAPRVCFGCLVFQLVLQVGIAWRMNGETKTGFAGRLSSENWKNQVCRISGKCYLVSGCGCLVVRIVLLVRGRARGL